LAFTGADIEEMTVFGAGALVVGGVLMGRSRRRNRVRA
jgi:LPXTG-motif cell wall-anchored protein